MHFIWGNEKRGKSIEKVEENVMKNWVRPEVSELNIEETACYIGWFIEIHSWNCKHQRKPSVPATPLMPATPIIPSNNGGCDEDINELS